MEQPSAGHRYKKLNDFYQHPRRSSENGIYEGVLDRSTLVVACLDDVAGKCFAMPAENSTTTILCKLLHVYVTAVQLLKKVVVIMELYFKRSNTYLNMVQNEGFRCRLGEMRGINFLIYNHSN